MSQRLRRNNGSEEQIGDVKDSVLTEPQFQSLHGSTWVLMDGRNISGSDLANLTGVTTLPDHRGLYRRASNNGGSSAGTRTDGNEDPAGVLAPGTFQADQFQGHEHSISWTTPIAGPNTSAWPMGGNGNFTLQTTNDDHSIAVKDPAADAHSNGTPRTGNETRVKGLIVNSFCKINK